MPSKCKCFSPSRNLASCSFLTSWLYSLNCLSYEDVIYGTSYLCSLSCFSSGDVICGTFVVCLATCTTVGTTYTIVGTTNGSILPLIIFCALTFVLSYSPFTLGPKIPPSSTLFFLLKALLRKSIVAFFLFSSLVNISSLVLLTLAVVSMDFPFDAQIDIERFLLILKQIEKYLSYPPYFP